MGRASAIVTAYAIPYGLTQALAGAVGDKFVALAALVFDRGGTVPVFAIAAVLWPALALWVWRRLRAR